MIKEGHLEVGLLFSQVDISTYRYPRNHFDSNSTGKIIVISTQDLIKGGELPTGPRLQEKHELKFFADRQSVTLGTKNANCENTPPPSRKITNPRKLPLGTITNP